ncbi:MAG: PEP-CTERM sorting domain-containing protein [Methylophilaceae bacterium]
MKNKLLASVALAFLVPAIAHAAPINWSSESYNILGLNDIDTPRNYTFQVNTTVPSLIGTLDGANAISTANATASTYTAITNLSNSSANIYQLTANGVTSYSGGVNPAANFAYSVLGASLNNSFIASDTALNIGYNYSAITNLSASATSNLASYQGLEMRVEMVQASNPFNIQTLNFNTLTESSIYPSGVSFTNSNSGTSLFNTIIGEAYTLYFTVAPDIYTTGTVSDNSANVTATFSFSDNTNIAAVPEPETYAMLLAGLALVGFTAKRRQQA